MSIFRKDKSKLKEFQLRESMSGLVGGTNAPKTKGLSFLGRLAQTYANLFSGGSAIDPRQFGRTGEARFTSPTAGGIRMPYGPDVALAIRYDDIDYRDYDLARFYPVLSDAIETVVNAVSRAGCHFVSPNDRAVQLANVLVKPHIRKLTENLTRGALQFGNQVGEKVEQYFFNVKTSSTQSDTGTPTYEFPIAVGFKKFIFFDPKDTILLVDTMTGDFGGIKQYIPNFPNRIDIPASKLVHYVNRQEYDSLYGFPQTKGSIPFVKLAEKLFDDASKWATIYGSPYKVGKFRPGFSPTGQVDSNGVPTKIDNRDLALGLLEGLESGASVAYASEFDPNTNQPYWGIDLLEVKGDGAQHFIELIKLVDDMIRIGFGIPGYATSESPERGTYTLGKSMIDLFLRQVNARLDGIKSVIDKQILEPWNKVNFGEGADPIVIEFEPPDIDPALMLMTAMVQAAAAGRNLIDGDGNIVVPDWSAMFQSIGVTFKTTKAPIGAIQNQVGTPGNQDTTQQQDVAGDPVPGETGNVSGNK